MKKIIGLVGPKGSGKTTLANDLVLNHNFRRISFAAPLKFMLRGLLIAQGLTSSQAVEMLDDSDLKEVESIYFENKTPRHAMQTLGTEWGRHLIGENLWINAWRRAVDYSNQSVVVDDLRFLNEAATIKSLGGIIVLISREDQPHTDLHASEQELKSIVTNHIVTNDVTGSPNLMLEQLVSKGLL